MIMFSLLSRSIRLHLIPLYFFSISIVFIPTVSSAAIAPGDLVISEVMANPAAVSDGNGEWFELYNRSNAAIDLSGLIIHDEGSNSHTVNSDSALIISAGDFFVFARNGDLTANGGFEADYVYSNFTLGNSSDAIILESMTLVVASLIYSDSTFGASGVSAEILSAGYGLTSSELIYGKGDIGTPGMAGSYTPVSQVPLPASGWLLGTALASVLVAKRKQQRH
jgi:hypothetical protein